MIIAEEYQVLLDEALNNRPENKKLILRLKKVKPHLLDDAIHQLHKEAFDFIDCLKCANCCKEISLRLTDKDIERLSKSAKMSMSSFSEKYIVRDTDDFFMLKDMPCPFLADDNYCNHYKDSPRACKEYPHTDRPRIIQILDLCLANTTICPVVAYVFAELRKTY